MMNDEDTNCKNALDLANERTTEIWQVMPDAVRIYRNLLSDIYGQRNFTI